MLLLREREMPIFNLVRDSRNVVELSHCLELLSDSAALLYKFKQGAAEALYSRRDELQGREGHGDRGGVLDCAQTEDNSWEFTEGILKELDEHGLLTPLLEVLLPKVRDLVSQAFSAFFELVPEVLAEAHRNDVFSVSR
jgi:hypothetical protein